MDRGPLAFGLQISKFDGIDVAEVARAAEAAGFTSLWVMDHFIQIPQVGREWEDMYEAYVTLGHLAAVTETVRLGTLVTGRTIPHLAKLVATLDVLSGGRAICPGCNPPAPEPAAGLLPATGPGPRADPGRRRRRAGDAQARRAPLFGEPDGSATSSPSCTSTARPPAATLPRST